MKFHTFKTVTRTLLYQFLLLFIGISVGFIANAEYVGYKSVILQRSFQHIFFPVRYDENVEKFVISLGRARLALLVFDDPFADVSSIISEEHVWGEEFYDALYRDPADAGKIKPYQTRVRWKPWEYYYEFHEMPADARLP